MPVQEQEKGKEEDNKEILLEKIWIAEGLTNWKAIAVIWNVAVQEYHEQEQLQDVGDWYEGVEWDHHDNCHTWMDLEMILIHL